MEIIKVYWSNWKFRAGVALTALVGLGCLLVVMNTAYDNATSIWEKAELVYSYAATPWLGVFMLIAVVSLAASGVKDVIAAQQRGRQRDHEMWEKETALRKQIAAPMREIVRLYQFRRDLDVLLNGIAYAKRRAELFRSRLNELADSGSVASPAMSRVEHFPQASHMDFFHCHLFEPNIALISFELPAYPPTWKITNPDFRPNTVENTTGRDNSQIFDPASQNNVEYIRLERENSTCIDAFIASLETLYNTQKANLEDQERNLWRTIQIAEY